MRWPRTCLPKSRDKILIPPRDEYDEARVVTLVRLVHEAPRGDLDRELWLVEDEAGAVATLALPFRK